MPIPSAPLSFALPAPPPLLPASAADVLVIVKRHAPGCPGTGYKNRAKCQCPKYLYFSRTRQRRSAFTRSWSDAESQAARIRDAADPVKRELAELKQKQAM